MLLGFERWVRRTLRLRPPYYRMRFRLERAVQSGELHPTWDFEDHWHEVERAVGGPGRHWLDQMDIDGLAEKIGVDYDEVRTVAGLIDLLHKIGDRYVGS